MKNRFAYEKVDVTERPAMAEILVQTFPELQKSFMVDLSSKLEFRQLKCIERQTSKLLRDMDSALHPVPPITIPISLHEPKIRFGPDLQIEKNIAASDGEYHPVKHKRPRLTKYERVRCQSCGEHNFLLGAADSVDCDKCGHSIMMNEQHRCTVHEGGTLVGTYVESHDFDNTATSRNESMRVFDLEK